MGAKEIVVVAAMGGGGCWVGRWLPPPSPNLPFYVGCWSKVKTAMLIGAWGSRYVELNHGNMCHKQQEVASIINSAVGQTCIAVPSHERPVQQPHRHCQEEVEGRAR